MKVKIVLLVFWALMLNGCGLGALIALPFKAIGAVTDVIAPESVGDAIRGIGSSADEAIPF